ncbi:MAG: hypothetical protein K5746_08685, partial [Clostridiales bacterium]|nr:hypothetical protein [Clostridiales bacterium]
PERRGGGHVASSTVLWYNMGRGMSESRPGRIPAEAAQTADARAAGPVAFAETRKNTVLFRTNRIGRRTA